MNHEYSITDEYETMPYKIESQEGHRRSTRGGIRSLKDNELKCASFWGRRKDKEVNWFYWNTAHMDAFKNLNSYYQYEIRRSKEVWDYWRNNRPSGCTGYYWTNLPNPTTTWSEENDPPWCCYNVVGDEEFEIKSEDINALKAETWYGGYAWFLRDSGEEGTSLQVDTESEYCGTGPFCNFGQTFDWCTMTSDSVNS